MPTVKDYVSATAESIVESLWKDEAGDIALDEGMAISDIERDTRVFTGELALLRKAQTGVPAIDLGYDRYIPVSLGYIYGPIISGIEHLDPDFGPDYDLFAYLLRRRGPENWKRRGFDLIDYDVAERCFREAAGETLALRIQALKRYRDKDFGAFEGGISMMRFAPRFGAEPVETPGCEFTVTTNTENLRVLWSGCHLLINNYFGHPTSPVRSTMQSGHFVFGVDSGPYGNQVQWDYAVVILPGRASVHLNY